jgi:hypothetical protein
LQLRALALRLLMGVQHSHRIHIVAERSIRIAVATASLASSMLHPLEPPTCTNIKFPFAWLLKLCAHSHGGWPLQLLVNNLTRRAANNLKQRHRSSTIAGATAPKK